MPKGRPDIPAFPYTALAVFDQGRLVDVKLVFPGKTRHAFGRGAQDRERAAALRAVDQGKVPVFVGAGLGAGIEAYLDAAAGPLAVVDRQEPLYAATGTRARFTGDPRVAWIDEPSPELAAKAVAAWLRGQGFPPAAAIADPACLRLDPDYCRAARERVEAIDSPRLRQAFGYRKFAGDKPSVVLLDSGYFLCREIKAACVRLGYPLTAVEVSGGEGFIERFLEAVRAARPDFAVTVNHLGLDSQGAFAALLERLRLPLASWFVDSPRLILHDYHDLKSPFTAAFSWDKGALATLGGFGFGHASFLPLATDELIFAATSKAAPAGHPWRAAVSFVGESMLAPVARNRESLAGFPGLLGRCPELAAGFAASPEREAVDFLRAERPEAYAACLALPDMEMRLAFEMLITWEATRLARLDRVGRLLDFSPLIVGDEGWKSCFAGEGARWRWHPPIEYYRDLPRFYPHSLVNFNCTSMQMKGAVNQRVFDVPACGGFVLTDEREQLAELFTPGKEVATHGDPGEIPELLRHYLARESEREAVARAGRERVLAEHTYVHRLRTMAGAMRKVFS
jgi:spore maturation protein CgeB